MMKIKTIITIGLIAAASLLTGCVGTKSNFDCNKVGGIQGCATLSDVKGMADQGDFTQNNNPANSFTAINGKPTGYFLKTPGMDTPASGSPMRYGETMQNIWIAPYVTKDGSYMWASMASIIVQQGHWIGEPTPAISNSGDV